MMMYSKSELHGSVYSSSLNDLAQAFKKRNLWKGHVGFISLRLCNILLYHERRKEIIKKNNNSNQVPFYFPISLHLSVCFVIELQHCQELQILILKDTHTFFYWLPSCFYCPVSLLHCVSCLFFSQPCDNGVNFTDSPAGFGILLLTPEHGLYLFPSLLLLPKSSELFPEAVSVSLSFCISISHFGLLSSSPLTVLL